MAQKIIDETTYYSAEARSTECAKFSVENLQKILDNDQAILLTAKDGDDIVGFCYGFFDCGTFWADWIGVLAEYRGKGVAMNLMKELGELLTFTNAHKIWCDTRCANTESNNLLKKNGFEQVAQLKNHWYGQDYYIWEKFLK
ncbi:MAG: GNAT family N-acetyltransferase [Patescibacteria group bacterium]|nr:GNAT family N-acetyltransferase [Patescibacteria group bacterium]